LARSDFPGRDHVERGGAMRGAKIGQRLGCSLEILGGFSAGRGARADGGLGDCLRQFVIGRMARSGGDRKIRSGASRAAHRLRA
jgi:hypothetical protein